MSLSEVQVRAYLVKRVKGMGGDIRKISWVGRMNAPDELVLLPDRPMLNFHAARAAEPVLAELKSETAGPKFPANAHERAQAREHEVLRKYGFRVEVIWSLKMVDELLEG